MTPTFIDGVTSKETNREQFLNFTTKIIVK